MMCSIVLTGIQSILSHFHWNDEMFELGINDMEPFSFEYFLQAGEDAMDDFSAISQKLIRCIYRSQGSVFSCEQRS